MDQNIPSELPQQPETFQQEPSKDTPTPQHGLGQAGSVSMRQAKKFPKFLITILIIAGILIAGYFAVAKYQKLWPFEIVVAPMPSVSATPDETAGWKTYRNDQYGFEFKYPDTWRIGGDEKTAYLAGNWYPNKPGMSALLCLPPDDCQDSTIRISAVEGVSIDEIIALEKKFPDQQDMSITYSKFLDNDAKILTFKDNWKEILFLRNKVAFSLSGPADRVEFNQILSTFTFIK